MKVVRSLVEDDKEGRLFDNPNIRDIQRHLYDLIWQAVRDKVKIKQGTATDPKSLFVLQIKRDQVVTVLGELIASHTEFANLITDVVSSKTSK